MPKSYPSTLMFIMALTRIDNSAISLGVLQQKLKKVNLVYTHKWILLAVKNEGLSFKVKWTELEDIILNEESQT